MAKLKQARDLSNSRKVNVKSNSSTYDPSVLYNRKRKLFNAEETEIINREKYEQYVPEFMKK